MSIRVLHPDELGLVAVGLLEGAKTRVADVVPIFERVARASVVNARAWATLYPDAAPQGPFTAKEIARAMFDRATRGERADLEAAWRAAEVLTYNTCTTDVATDEEYAEIHGIERAVFETWLQRIRPARPRRKRSRAA